MTAVKAKPQKPKPKPKKVVIKRFSKIARPQRFIGVR